MHHILCEVIRRDGNLIFTPFIALKHLIFPSRRYLIFIRLARISFGIVLFFHKSQLQITKRAAVSFQSVHRKAGRKKRTQSRGAKEQIHLFCQIIDRDSREESRTTGMSSDPIVPVSLLNMMHVGLFIFIL